MRFHLASRVWLLVIGGWLLVVGCSGQPEETIVVEAATAVLTPTASVPMPETAVPTAATAEEPVTPLWTYDSGDAINHPPVSVGDLLITVPQNGPVTALNVQSGDLAWHFDPPERIWDRAYASDGRSFFIGLENGKLVALDVQTGAINWETELGINAQTPLYLAEGVLYVSTTFVGPGTPADPFGQAKLFAFNPDDGQELWAFTSDNYILQTAARFGDTVYVGGSYKADVDVDEGGPMRLYALAAADGTEKWAYESLDGYPKQLFANETAVAYIAYQDFANGVSAQTGQSLWRKDTGNWVPSLSGAGDTVYFGSANTIVHALNVADGAVVWQFNIPEGTFNYLLGAPVPLNDRLYFLTQQGDLFAIDAADGRQQWHYATGIVAARTGPAIANNKLFIGDADGIIHAYAIKTP